MIKNKNQILFKLSFFVFFLSFGTVLAKGYTLIQPLPSSGQDLETVTSLGQYLKSVIQVTISLAIVLAVLQLSRAGFVYLTTEAFTEKKEAKGIITNALVGLLVALLSYLGLAFINPDLVEIDLNIPGLGATPR